jgi:zinc finger protein-like protein
MGSKGKAPLLFFYTHLHDAIRAELDSLSESVLQLEKLAVREHSPPEFNGHLTHLRERYRFLEQVYKYHSSVEDEVNMDLLADLGPARTTACAFE